MKQSNPLLLYNSTLKSLSRDQKIKFLENYIAEGEDIRYGLRTQVKYLQVGIGTRHFKIDSWKSSVKGWFESLTDSLEELFDSRIIASKFRNSYSLPIDNLSTPKITIINIMSEEEQLEDLDRTMKRGIWNTEKIIKKLEPKSNTEPSPSIINLGPQARLNLYSTDNSTNISNDQYSNIVNNLETEFEQNYHETDKSEMLSLLGELKNSQNNSKKSKEILGTLLTKGSELAQVASLAIQLLTMLPK